MRNFSSSSFTELYYRMLSTAAEEYGAIPISESRVGQVCDLGQAYFSIESDAFRMPLLLKRGFNPFFAFAEFAWFIKGDNTLLPLQKILPNYAQYSDDQKTLNGAYGARLRRYFGFDQINRAIDVLNREPTSRRVVLQLWSADDLGEGSKDIPCNTQIMLKIKNGKLNLTVVNRSNDLFRGVPYNVFLFFMLQKYLASKIGCGVGVQSHFTDSLHVYCEDILKVKLIVERNLNLNFRIINEAVKKFTWDILLNDAKILDFFFNTPYAGVNKNFLGDARNIFYFNEDNCDSLRGFQKISENPLALISLLWHDTFDKILPTNFLFRGFFMMKNRSYFEGFKYVDAKTLIKGASLFAASEKEKAPQITQMLIDNYIARPASQLTLLKATFLASVLATVDTQFLAPLQCSNFFATFESACEQLKLDYNYLTKLVPVVESVWDH